MLHFLLKELPRSLPWGHCPLLVPYQYTPKVSLFEPPALSWEEYDYEFEHVCREPVSLARVFVLLVTLHAPCSACALIVDLYCPLFTNGWDTDTLQNTDKEMSKHSYILPSLLGL